MSEILITDLSKSVAAFLNTNFGHRFTAKHNSSVFYLRLEDLANLQVDVWPGGLDLTAITRTGLSSEYALNVAFQQRATTQDKVDELTEMVVEVLRFILRTPDGFPRRFLNSIVTTTGAFAGQGLFDGQVKYEDRVFQSVITVSFKRVI